MVRDAVESPDDSGHILIAGKYWLESFDRGTTWDEVKPKGVKVGNPGIAVGGGWRYVFEGGMITGSLYAGETGREFQKRELPASDVRVLVVNPENGSEIWIGTWGQGVFRSTNGGTNWEYAGLKKIQVRAMAVDFKKREVLVGSSNLFFDRGIYRATY
jgi:photosystem II stability/assembly factor-like uncharacterized protein